MSPDQPAQFHDFLRNRRSIRKFRVEAVPDEIMQRILETTIWAPNAHNAQTWRFVRLQSQQSRRSLAEAMADEYSKALKNDGLTAADIDERIKNSRARILGAPELVLICVDSEAILRKYRDANRSQGEQTMAVQSAALAGGQLLLAAHAEGLGAFWMCSPLFTPVEVARALDIPDSWQAQGMILLGYPAGELPTSSRTPLKQVLKTR